MKISSASKKVLASALSAAMVVAFAPAAAFGAVAAKDTINVTFDTAGVTVAEAQTELSGVYTATAASATAVALDKTLAGHGYQFDANTPVLGWYYDSNEDGQKSDGDITIAANGTDFTFTGDADAKKAAQAKLYNGASLTFKPYSTDEVVSAAFANTTVKTEYAAWNNTTGANNKLSFTIANASGKATGQLRAALTKGTDGKEIAYSLVDAIDNGGSKTVDFKFTGNTTAAAGEIKTTDWGKGEYTLTVRNVGDNKVVATKKVGIVELTLGGLQDNHTKNGKTVLAIQGESFASQIAAADRAQKQLADGSYVDCVGYANAAGKVVAKWNTNRFETPANVTEKIAGDATLTPVYGDAAILEELAYDGALKVKLNYHKSTYVADPAAAETVKYVIATTGAATYTKTVLGKDVTDGDAIAAYGFGSAGAAAGTYTVTVTEVIDDGVHAAKSTLVGTKSITLTKVNFDAGDKGKLAADFTATVYDSTKKLKDVTKPANPTVTADTYRFVGWSLDGTNVISGNELIGASEVTLKAVYASSAAAKPAFAYADGKLSLSTAAGAGWKVVYNTDNDKNGSDLSDTYDYTAPITVDPTKDTKYYVQVVKTDNTLKTDNSAIIAISNSKTTAGEVKAYGTAVMAKATGASTTAKPQYYSDVLKTLATDAESAVKAVVYNDADGWAKIKVEQGKAILKAVADYETAQIDAYGAGAIQADGSMLKTAATTVEAKKAAIQSILADFDAANDNDAKTRVTGTYAGDLAEPATYVTKVAEASKAVVDAAAKIAKADVDAAAAVTAQLKDPKTAAAGLEAYAALSAAAKELVSAADVAAAEAAVAQAKLVKAQDKAAAATGKAQVKGTTYKIKAKGSKTIKIAKSASGAKVTLKQVSGTKYAKVSGTKVTLKKAAKKGKKYTIKVKAVCGATTTSTVSFKVLVK